MKLLKCTVLAALIGLTASGCNQMEQLPVGASLGAFPQQVKWLIGPSDVCDVSEGNYNDSLVTLSLVDAENRGLLEVPVDLSLDLSGATFNGPEVLSLYYDSNFDGLYTDEEKVSVAGGPVFRTKTDDTEGVVRLMVRANLSCPYRGQLFAFAGSAAVSVLFEVSAVTSN